VNGEDVVTFLLQDRQFPRSVVHSLAKLETGLQALPNNDAALVEVTRVQNMANHADIPLLLQQGLLEYIDLLQIRIAEVHARITQTWFLPVVSGQHQTP